MRNASATVRRGKKELMGLSKAVFTVARACKHKSLRSESA